LLNFIQKERNENSAEGPLFLRTNTEFHIKPKLLDWQSGSIVEQLHSKSEALSSNPSTRPCKKKKNKRKENTRTHKKK
jgi:hypothetical protein